MRRLGVCLWLFLILIGCEPKPKNSPLLTEIFQSAGEKIPEVVANPENYRIQIIYTQIDRKKDQSPVFTTHTFRLDTTRYFYPASTVKFPAAVLALDKLTRYASLGISKDSKVSIGTGFSGMTPVFNDSSSQSGDASIGHYIKKILVASDDDAFNRIYEFLGQEYLNERLWELGFSDVRISHRLSIPLSVEENRHTNPIQFYDNQGRRMLGQPMARSPLDLTVNADGTLLGTAYISKGERVSKPMDFSKKNFYHLAEQQRFLRQIIFPETVPKNKQLYLKKKDYEFLYQWMSTLPRKSQYPTYNDYSKYYDGYCKFFMVGDSKDQLSDHIRIFNKVGWAYGFLIDNAYIIDTLNGVEFFLSAVIYANSNDTLNDGIYDYDSIALPFLAKLGKAVYNYDLKRERSIRPDFSRFIVNK